MPQAPSVQPGYWIKWFSRFGFLALFLFGIANYFGILTYSLDYTWFGLLITAFGALGCIEGSAWLLRKKAGVEMPWVVWPLAFASVLFDVVGDVFHLYENVVWFDQSAHFLGTMTSTLVFLLFFQVLQKAKGWKYPPILNLVLAFGMAMTLGVLYEIEEYLEDMIGTANRLGDGEDTANDLLLNWLGATAVFGMAWARHTFKKTIRTKR